MTGRLADKVAVVTGGASGMGERTVELFVREGAKVVIADILDERGRALAERLGGNARYQHTDVTSEDEIAAAVGRAVSDFGRLDCMFNNAGIAGIHCSIAEVPVDKYEEAMAVLLRGVLLGMKHAAKVMIPQGSGSIISTASVAGLRTGIGPHVYSAAKAAVIHLTRTVAAELGPHNIRVNCICPGGIATPIFAKSVGLPVESADETVAKVRKVLSRLQPIPRAGEPEDIAQAALFLASDESGFITGHPLVVDGGFIGGRPMEHVREFSLDLLNAMRANA